jgi:hypothetical protein
MAPPSEPFIESLFTRDFHLLMNRFQAAPFTEFFELDLALNLLFVLMNIIITPLAGGASEGDKIVGTLHFCHGTDDITAQKENQPLDVSLSFISS